AQATNGLEPARVDARPWEADIEERANGAVVYTAGSDTGFQFGDARFHELAMQRHLCRLALRPRIRRVNADRDLQQWIAIDRKKRTLGEGFDTIPPSVEAGYDLLRHGLLQRDEGIVRRCGLALLAHRLRQGGNRCDPGILVRQQLVLQPQ